MGILDNIIQSGENQIQSEAESKVRNAISSGFGRVGGGPSNKAPVCPKCKAQLSDPPPKFCPRCGTKLAVTCPKCKNDYTLGTKFCPNDGSKLA
ncbi:MAG: zinc ribbon domain-containing protein [Candidatus Micrarchaeota archaeon]|nr:zinc ribbon domain-containing protein [Candidatus Micrarchaeota archaeon]